MPVWGFIFVLFGAVLFAVASLIIPAIWNRLIALGLSVLAIGIIFTFATTGSSVHF